MGGPEELYYFAEDASANPTFYASLVNPQSLNKYQYAYNNPLRYVDPDGHQSRSRTRPGPPPPPLTLDEQTARAIADSIERAWNAAGATLVGIWSDIKSAGRKMIENADEDPEITMVRNMQEHFAKRAGQQGQTGAQDRGGETAGPGGADKKPILGEKGTQTTSTTVYRGTGKERIDVENPNPGQRAGQIHYQDNKGNKYLYDPTKKEFTGASKSVNKRLLSDRGIQKGIEKALKVLGEAQ